MIDEKYIANRIKQLCDKKHMSMYALAKKSNISESLLSNVMKKGTIPTFLTVDKICDALEITMAQFFTTNSEIPDLTSEQKRVLEVWDSLSKREKKAVEIYVRGIKLE